MSPSPPRSAVTLTTRGSKLALWQANYVASLLAKMGVTSQQLVVKTTADRVQDRFLHELGGKGLFVKELEEALLSETADLAVHSLKDMPARLKEPFTLAAVLARHSPADVLIFRDDVAKQLSPKPHLTASDVASFGPLRVGTGSLRRQALLKRHAPEITTEGVRGNVDTRLAKLQAGAWDALILAEASLDRLGIQNVARSRLNPTWFVPAAAQGALAIEARADDPLAAWLACFADPDTTFAVTVERNVLSRLGGDCTMPFGCHVTVSGAGEASASAIILNRAGQAAEATCQGKSAAGPGILSEAIFRSLLQNGAEAILRDLDIKLPR